MHAFRARRPESQPVSLSGASGHLSRPTGKIACRLAADAATTPRGETGQPRLSAVTRRSRAAVCRISLWIDNFARCRAEPELDVRCLSRQGGTR
eukprot:7077361-Alexandrium_andersonii.AAC.1